MATKYPIILVHGVALKDIRFFKAFGNIEKLLSHAGYTVSTAPTDGFGSIESNAEQLQAYVEKILAEANAEKVNLIAHSKGGLDSRYMIDKLGMKDKIASVTFLCTPHKGSGVASLLYELPKPTKGFIASWINLWYRLFGDKHPDALTVCRQLKYAPDGALEHAEDYEGIFLQSYTTVMEKGRDDFVMSIPLRFSRRYENDESDGMVTVHSAKFGEYRGHCTDGSVSHSEIVDFMVKESKKEKIYLFYLSLCEELGERGY